MLETKMEADKESAERAASSRMELAMTHAASLEMQGQAALCEQLRGEVAELTRRLQKSEAARRILHNINQVRC